MSKLATQVYWMMAHSSWRELIYSARHVDPRYEPWFPHNDPSANDALGKIEDSYGKLAAITRSTLKPTEEEFRQIMSALTDGLNELETSVRRGSYGSYGSLPHPLILRNASYSETSVSDRVDAIIDACKSSFIINRLYPFIGREHNKPASGNTLSEHQQYGGVRTLSGDKLKAAIMEIMLDRLSEATAENLSLMVSEIKSSPAWHILTTPQSTLGMGRFFNKGKTTSQAVMEQYFNDRGRELGVDLSENQPLLPRRPS